MIARIVDICSLRAEVARRTNSSLNLSYAGAEYLDSKFSHVPNRYEV